ncbi:MAG: P-II family nitrogen regulator [Rhodospirillaceae bacterium]
MHSLKLVTLVAESLLEKRLLEEMRQAGASGYTTSPAHGEGSRDLRTGLLEEGNVRIEVIVTEEVAEKIMARMESAYFPYYAVICWLTDVSVVRADKYAGSPRERPWLR